MTLRDIPMRETDAPHRKRRSGPLQRVDRGESHEVQTVLPSNR